MLIHPRGDLSFKLVPSRFSKKHLGQISAISLIGHDLHVCSAVWLLRERVTTVALLLTFLSRQCNVAIIRPAGGRSWGRSSFTSSDVMDEALTEHEDGIADLKTSFSVLWRLRVQIHSVKVAETKSGLSWAHVISDELCNLLKSIRCLDALGHEEVKEVGVVDVFGALEGEDFRLGVSIEIVKLVLEQVDLVLPWHDIFALFGLFLSFCGHWCKVVVDHVEYTWLLSWGLRSYGLLRRRLCLLWVWSENLRLLLFAWSDSHGHGCCVLGVDHYIFAFFFDSSFSFFIYASDHASIRDILAELVSDLSFDSVEACVMNVASWHAGRHLWNETRRQLKWLEIAPEQVLQVSLDSILSFVLKFGNATEWLYLSIKIENQPVNPVIVLEVCIGLD